MSNGIFRQCFKNFEKSLKVYNYKMVMKSTYYKLSAENLAPLTILYNFGIVYFASRGHIKFFKNCIDIKTIIKYCKFLILREDLFSRPHCFISNRENIKSRMRFYADINYSLFTMNLQWRINIYWYCFCMSTDLSLFTVNN